MTLAIDTVLAHLLPDIGRPVPYKVIKDLLGGRSGAGVILIDLLQDSECAPQGQYVLKYEVATRHNLDDRSEATRHATFVAGCPAFAEEHIPHLQHACSTTDMHAMLYRLAGDSILRSVVAESSSPERLEAAYRALSRDLLLEMNHDSREPNYGIGARDLVESWLAYRLHESEAPGLHKALARFAGGEPILRIGPALLPNPMAFIELLRDDPASATEPVFLGRTHGDLNTRNLLLRSPGIGPVHYWLIDLALSDEYQGLLFDHAYLEMATLLTRMPTPTPEALIATLSHLDPHPYTTIPTTSSIAQLGVRQLLGAIRSGVASAHEGRVVAWDRQYALARVAAGINWANKPMATEERDLALAYAASGARHYLTEYWPEGWNLMLRPGAPKSIPPHRTLSQLDEHQMDVVLGLLEDAQDARTTLILISSIPERTYGAALRPLSGLDWNIVFDLDPATDQAGGLYHAVASALLSRRAVQLTSRYQEQATDADAGTLWLTANGWITRGEAPAADYRTWLRERLPVSRATLTDYVRRTLSARMRVVVIAEDDSLSPLALRLLEACEELLPGEHYIDIFAASRASESFAALGYDVAMAPDDLFAFLQDARGYDSRERRNPTLPGHQGHVEIDLGRLRALQQDLEILHSDVLRDAQVRSQAEYLGFYRGRPPTWNDIHEDLDLPRQAGLRLKGYLAASLRRHGPTLLHLNHSPGAGGTTLSRRVAWDLRRDYPICFVTRMTSHTIDRLDELYQLTKSTVLCILDSAVVDGADVPDLLAEVRDRNLPIVFLRVARIIGSAHSGSVRLLDPMEDAEARLFATRYCDIIGRDVARCRRLHALAHEVGSPATRSPFFFGLVAFEAEYLGLDSYVEGHLQGAPEEQRRLVTYLAVVTRFSQKGMPFPLLLELLGIQLTRNWRDFVDPGVLRLVVESRQSVRLLHPLMAERVLAYLYGRETWHNRLSDICVDMISTVCAAADALSAWPEQLFDSLFIQRPRGSGRVQGEFSELIQAIPSEAGAHRVLSELTAQRPGNAHYWNHLGRHHAYQMRSDYAQAEEYLERATELTEEDDPVHLHTLGLVRRFWIVDDLKSMVVRGEPVSPDDLLATIGPRYSAAMDAFNKARSLARQSSYNYVTPVQLALETMEYIERLMGPDSLSARLAADDALGSWLRHEFARTVDLIAQLELLSRPWDENEFLARLRRRLSRVLSDLESFIEGLEARTNELRNDADFGRSLAYAYYQRSDRRWSAVDEEDLRRANELLTGSLMGSARSSRDMRLWWQTYRNLPEFSYLKALEWLEAWWEESRTDEAAFNLFVVHLTRWIEGRERSHEDAMEWQQRAASQRRLALRQLSYEWLAQSPLWFPVVHHLELGVWSKRRNFYRDTARLVRVTGRIEEIRSPRSGSIDLGGPMKAFFVPGTEFFSPVDLDSLVSFYLGFSYEGLRAWRVASEGEAPGDVHPLTERGPVA